MNTEQQGGVVDFHEFSIWRYEHDSVDIQMSRDAYHFDPRAAYDEASVIARSLGEELNQTEEVLAFRLYENGLCSASYRGETNNTIIGWRRFKWMRERVAASSYKAVMNQPPPPEPLLVCLWAVEYAVSCHVRLWRIATGKPVLDPQYQESAGDQEQDQPASAPAPAAAPLGDNVVAFRPRAN
jgi:hypothetical protein